MKSGRLLEDIKSKVDIVDFISSYVQLKKSGQNWKGTCPFHSEKTPSFMVNQAKQIFHCFGCGAGGDVISFVQRYENISFMEALTLMAKKAGIALPATRADRKDVQKEDRMRNALREAGDYFTKKLGESADARDYLLTRGLSDESVETFRVGYAPPGWYNLVKHLRVAGYEDSVVREAGLAVQGDRGIYDMFRHRIIFPILSLSGNVLAFGGRALDDSTPKYINSPETAAFRKSDTLFGLYTAKEEIRKQRTVCIVEGYLDVIVCHQYGFRNVVAPLGTSLTAGHVQKLRSMADRAVLVFDGDAAGRAAAKRALSLIYQNNFRASVLLLPEKEDPDSYLRRHGGDAFGKLFERTQGMVDFLFTFSDTGTDTVREALSVIAGIGDVLTAGEMLVELSRKTRISEEAIREEFGRIKSGLAGSRRRKGDPGRGPSQTGSSEEYLLLSVVINFPEKRGYVLSKIDPGDIRDRTALSLFKKFASSGAPEPASVLETADEEERAMITRFSVDPGLDPEHIDRNIEDCLRRIEGRKLDAQLKTSGDAAFYNSGLLEKRKLIKGKCHESQ